MIFGEITDVVDDIATVKPLTKVYISPQQAKAIARVLNKNIKGYEDTLGPIADGAAAED